MSDSERGPAEQFSATSDADEAPYPSERYAWYVVGILMLANVSSFVDRQILSLLVGPIRRDLQISDTQMSLLLGLSFALFYTILGFPIGRLADSRSRRGIIALGIVAWSLMTALSGLARSYSQLLLARIGVGVGEASLGPPAYSLLADYFPREKLATAVSVFGIGIYLGSGLAYFIGGTVVELVAATDALQWPIVGAIRPWQSVFFIVGLPGLLVALLMLTVREPARRGLRGGTAHAVSLSETFAYLRSHARTYTAHGIGFSLFALVNYGTAAWLPTFLTRTHGWNPAKIGLYMGGATMIFGVLGIVAGGRIADRLLRIGYADAKLRVGVVAAVGALLSAVPLYLVNDERLVMLLLIPLNIFSAFPFGAAGAALVEMTPGAIRGQVTAIYLFVINIVGFTLGPTSVALFTDYVFRDDAAVRYSILSVASMALTLAAILLVWGFSSYRRTVAVVDHWRPQG